MKTLLRFVLSAIRLFAGVIAFGAAMALVAAQGGRFSDRLDVITHFTPILLGLAAVALVLWVLAGGRRLARPTPILVGIAVVCAAGLMIPELSRPASAPPPAEGETIKLVQFNVWGRSGHPKGMLEWIIAQDADIVVIEEGFGASRGVTKALRKHFPHNTSCAEPRGCSTIVFSKFKPVEERGLARPPSALTGALATYETSRGRFSVVGVHYTWPIPAGPQQQQTRRLAEVLDPLPRGSTIVAGDFNSTPWSFSLRRQDRRFGLERRTRALPSWPAAKVSRYKIGLPFPVLPIDHVYAGSDWKTVSVERGPALGSDHFPIVVTLRR